ncbi:MAG: ribonuclease HII [Chlamydiia bacterium]
MSGDQLEREVLAQGHLSVAGIDEAGRGPLAGPVYAACVLWDPAFDWRGIRDSKIIPAKEREELAQRIEQGLVCAVASASVEEIEELNILQATFLAMRRAWKLMAQSPAYTLVDGCWPRLEGSGRKVIRGDDLSVSCGAASILAKVARDRWMTEQDRLWPQYGFAQHKGYGTPQHLAALRTHGPCAIHRRSFAPVAALQEAAT